MKTVNENKKIQEQETIQQLIEKNQKELEGKYQEEKKHAEELLRVQQKEYEEKIKKLEEHLTQEESEVKQQQELVQL